ncbi:MAG: hypothetical protein ACPGXL_05180 [Chitinophagales bacterium]
MNKRKTLEQGKPIKESMIWNMGTNYYFDKGTDAFAAGEVPDNIISNTAIASAYARMIIAFLNDLAQQGYTDEVYIMELGGGNGKLALRILTCLEQYYLSQKNPPLRFKYFLTDAVTKNQATWQQINKLNAFVQAGILDFGTLFVGKDFQLDTVHNGTITKTNLGDKAVVLVSNYLFCSIPGDVVWIKDGKIYEQIVTVYEEETTEENEKLALFDRVGCKLRDGAVLNTPYHEHPFIHKMLAKYQEKLNRAYVSFSPETVYFFEHFLKRNAPLLSLYGDLAYADLHHFQSKTPLIHNRGYFATYTNLHLLRALFDSYGGKTVVQENPDPHFQIAALMKPTNAENKLIGTAMLARQLLHVFSPYDVYNVCKLFVGTQELDEDEVYSWLRLTHYDPKIASLAITCLDNHFIQKKKLRLPELCNSLFRIVSYMYPNERGTKGLDKGIVHLLLKVGLKMEALQILEQIIVLLGETPQRLYLKALVLSLLDDLDRAKPIVEQLLTENPDFAEAKQLAIAIENHEKEPSLV